MDRDIFVVTDGGYDLHSENTLSTLLTGANGALTRFTEWLKNEGLWDNTAILMASDFGRSLNPNSNGGTDHAWGGNYFLIGGKVNGGKILGDFPTPLSKDHPNWIGRGRFIPTTPWDSVWNGVAQWLGVTSEADLDFILPNRGKFPAMFSGSDLFTDVSNPTNPPNPPGPTPTNPPPSPSTPSPTPSSTTSSLSHYEAEDQTLSGGTKAGSSNEGFTGTGYADMGGSGSSIEFPNVAGGSGGACQLMLRYAQGGSSIRPCSVTVNGVLVGEASFSQTASWTDWQTEVIETTCAPGTNVIRVTATSGAGGPNVDKLTVSLGEPPNATPIPTQPPTSQVCFFVCLFD